MTGRQPQRTCLGCRQVRTQASLVRIVCSPENDILVDLKGRLPGRGAYLCNDRECVENALRKHQFNRAFKKDCNPLEANELIARISNERVNYLVNLLGMAKKSARFVAGSNAVIDAMTRKSPLAVVVLARDISSSIGNKVRNKAKFNNIEVVELLSKVELGSILGRAERSVVGLSEGKLADAFLSELQRYQDISGEN